MAGKRPQPTQQSSNGYIQCDWVSGGTRCRYPGSLSSNTGPGGPWYCRPHYDCKDAMLGASIVDASADYTHQVPGRTAEDTARAKAYCESLGLHTIEQKRAWLRNNVGKVGQPKEKAA